VDRLAKMDSPAPDGWHEFMQRQEPIGRDRETLDTTFAILSHSAEKLSRNADAEHRKEFESNLDDTIRLVRALPAQRRKARRAGLLRQLESLRSDYENLGKTGGAGSGGSGSDSAASGAAPASRASASGASATRASVTGAADGTVSTATLTATSIYDGVARLVHERRAFYDNSAKLTAADIALFGHPTLDAKRKFKRDSAGLPVNPGGVLAAAANLRKSADAAHARAFCRAVASFERIAMSEEDTIDSKRLNAFVKRLNGVEGLGTSVAESEPAPKRAPHVKPTLTPAPDNLVFQGTLVYTKDANGKLVPLPDGDYSYRNRPLLVRSGKKIILSN
jgi:hypothetical protein